jgi:hypothetical protein
MVLKSMYKVRVNYKCKTKPIAQVHTTGYIRKKPYITAAVVYEGAMTMGPRFIHPRSIGPHSIGPYGSLVPYMMSPL